MILSQTFLTLTKTFLTKTVIHCFRFEVQGMQVQMPPRLRASRSTVVWFARRPGSVLHEPALQGRVTNHAYKVSVNNFRWIIQAGRAQ